ncbi:MAG: nucleoside phosphorylase [Deltaproteobacteria bacterium]|nr:nucleoside phosphorylase [Deltaproteobacteria bacterium]
MSETSEGLIVPRRRRTDPEIGPIALMVAMEKDVALMRRSTGISGKAAGRILTSRVFTERQSGRQVTVVGPMLGAPHAVMVLEKLVALGAKKMVFLGWCGSIDPRVAIGDLVIPDHAVVGEGTSKYYAKNKSHVPSRGSAAIRKVLEEHCDKHGVMFHKGGVWSTDAPYRETEEVVRSLKEAGLLGVDMETSALFTAGCFRGIDIGALLVVSDALGALIWEPGFSSRKFLAARKAACEILADSCAALSL